MRATLTLLLAIIAVPAFAVPDSVNEVNRGYHQVLLRCPERIWPGVDWSKTQMMFTSKKDQKAYLIGAASATVQEIPPKEVPAMAFDSFFSFITFRGVITVTVTLDSRMSESEYFGFAVHELFHFVGQKGWVYTGGRRGTLIPLQDRPRYVRHEIFRSLQKSFLEQDSLAPAAGWYQEWFNNFPDEVKSTTDGYEGTARYVENVASGLKAQSCAITPQELAKQLKSDYEKIKFSPGRSLDHEGYEVGSLAGVLLDQLGIDWKPKAALGQTPLELLLKDQGTAPLQEDAVLAQLHKASVDGQNAQIDVWRIPFESRKADREVVRLIVPSSWGNGSYSPRGFYIPASDPSQTYIPFNGDHLFKNNTGEWIQAADRTVTYSMEQQNPCGTNQWHLLVDKADIVENAGRMTSASGQVTFDIQGEYKTDANGFTYLCNR